MGSHDPRGYELEPEEIRLAVRWLELNEPEAAVGLGEVRQRLEADGGVKRGNPSGRNQHSDQGVKTEEFATVANSSATDAAPKPTQRQRAERNKVSPATQRHIDHLARDRPDLLARVEAGEMKVKTAAREAGIVKTPTALDLLRAAWGKASEEERSAFLDEVGTTPGTCTRPVSPTALWKPC